MKKNSVDKVGKAIRNLIKYAKTAQWDPYFHHYHHEYVQEIFQRLEWVEEEDDQGELFHSVINQMGLESTFFGYIFEGFSCHQWIQEDSGDQSQSLIESYCARRGWAESAQGLNFLKKLQAGQFDLWEIVKVDPGIFMDVRRYGTKEKLIRVSEKSASQMLEKGQCIATRILKMDAGHYEMSGGSLLMPSHMDFSYIKEMRRTVKKEIESYRNFDAGMTDALIESGITHYMGIEFASIWFLDAFNALNTQNSEPDFVMKNGENIVPSSTRFAIKSRKKAAVERALMGADWLVCERVNRHWLWLDKMDEYHEDLPLSVQGFIYLDPEERCVYLETLTIEMAQIGTEKLQVLLEGLVDRPLTLHDTNLFPQSVQDVPQETISEEEELAVMQEYLMMHYRKTLDDKVPMLDNLTPRQCSKKSAYQQRLLQWVKEMEVSVQRIMKGKTVDMTWLRDELGIDHDA